MALTKVLIQDPCPFGLPEILLTAAHMSNIGLDHQELCGLARPQGHPQAGAAWPGKFFVSFGESLWLNALESHILTERQTSGSFYATSGGPDFAQHDRGKHLGRMRRRILVPL